MKWCLPVGLWGLAFWLSGGILLEALHGFKAAPYLEDSVRRLTWTLAHAHGTLFSALCLLLWVIVPKLGLAESESRWVDRLWVAGTITVPVGFFLGGVWHHEGDPGLFVLLVPLGGILLVSALGIAIVRRARA